MRGDAERTERWAVDLSDSPWVSVERDPEALQDRLLGAPSIPRGRYLGPVTDDIVLGVGLGCVSVALGVILRAVGFFVCFFFHHASTLPHHDAES